MTLIVESAHQPEAERALDEGRRLIEEAEGSLSRFRPHSELCRLNARTGTWTPVSPLLLEVLGVALRAAESSGGLCTPTLLGALEAAGYDRDFDALAADPGASSVTGAAAHQDARDGAVPSTLRDASGRTSGRPRCVVRRRLRRGWGASGLTRAWRAIRVDAARSRVWLPPGCRLDLAGVAKGWTADRVADLLASVGPCLVDAGGDIAARGAPAGLDGWPVSVIDPRRPDDDLALVLLRDAGLATSGTDVRHWTVNGRPRHHLIDPRTSRPARTDVLTASAIAQTTAEAEVLAKVALLLGTTRGLSTMTRERQAGLIVRQDGRVLVSPRWSDYAFTG